MGRPSTTEGEWARAPTRAQHVPDSEDDRRDGQSPPGRVDVNAQVGQLPARAGRPEAALAVWGSGVRVPSAPPILSSKDR